MTNAWIIGNLIKMQYNCENMKLSASKFNEKMFFQMSTVGTGICVYMDARPLVLNL